MQFGNGLNTNHQFHRTNTLKISTLFATISPIYVAALFSALTPNTSDTIRSTMALKGSLIARAILIVFPLATPLISGPCARGAVILLMAEANGNWHQEVSIIAAIVAIQVLNLLMLLMADLI